MAAAKQAGTQDQPPAEQGKSDTPKEELATVVEHAIATGHAKRVKVQVQFGGGGHVPKEPVLQFDAEHAAAAQLHGWSAHLAATGSEFRCTLEAYNGAISAVQEKKIERQSDPGDRARTVKRGDALPQQKPRPTYVPHKPALSVHAALHGRKAGEK